MNNIKAAYESWLENEMTQKFLDEIENSIEDLQMQTRTGLTIEQIGMNEIVRTTNIETLYKVKTWKPQELLTNE